MKKSRDESGVSIEVNTRSKVSPKRRAVLPGRAKITSTGANVAGTGFVPRKRISGTPEVSMTAKYAIRRSPE